VDRSLIKAEHIEHIYIGKDATLDNPGEVITDQETFFHPTMETKMDGEIGVSDGLSNRDINIVVSCDRHMVTFTYNYWTYHDIFSKVGGYFALFLPFLALFAPLSAVKFFLELAEVIKKKYADTYKKDLKETIAKYQVRNQDWQPINDNEDIPSLETRFDKVTGAYLSDRKDKYLDDSSMMSPDKSLSQAYSTNQKLLAPEDEYMKEGGVEMVTMLTSA